MKVDCEAYRAALDKCLHVFEKYQEDKTNACTIIGVSGHIPLIAVVEYALAFIWPEESSLKLMRDRLIRFYDYDEVVTFKP